MNWKVLLRTEPVVDAVLGCLQSSDAVCWLVWALESANEIHRRYHIAQSQSVLEDSMLVLHCAATHGCVNAVYKLHRLIPLGELSF